MKYNDEATSQPKQQVGLGIPGYDRATTMLKLHHGMSAFIWLAWPPLTLLSFRSTRGEASFRAQPYNNSYDAIFIAAMAGIGATSLCALVLSQRVNRAEANVFPAHLSWRNAFVLFELFSQRDVGHRECRCGREWFGSCVDGSVCSSAVHHFQSSRIAAEPAACTKAAATSG